MSELPDHSYIALSPVDEGVRRKLRLRPGGYPLASDSGAVLAEYLQQNRRQLGRSGPEKAVLEELGLGLRNVMCFPQIFARGGSLRESRIRARFRPRRIFPWSAESSGGRDVGNSVTVARDSSQ